MGADYSKAMYTQWFYAKYYGNLSFIEWYNLPIGLREWYVKMLGEEIKKTSEAKQGKKTEFSPPT